MREFIRYPTVPTLANPTGSPVLHPPNEDDFHEWIAPALLQSLPESILLPLTVAPSHEPDAAQDARDRAEREQFFGSLE